jgi:hypothetical protein
MNPVEVENARAYIRYFRAHVLPGTDHAKTSDGRTIWLDCMSDEDAVFVAAEFKRMEGEAAKRRRVRDS